MKRNRLVALLFVSALVACEDKKEGAAASASASASAAPVASAAPAASASAAPEAPAASASAAASDVPPVDAAPSKDAVVTVRDPVAEPKKTTTVLTGGKVTLYLPEYPGTKWTVTSSDKALGKPKEETIPGFAGPSTPAHQFTWTTPSSTAKGPAKSAVVVLANTKKGEAKADKTFTLTVEMR